MVTTHLWEERFRMILVGNQIILGATSLLQPRGYFNSLILTGDQA